MGALVFPFAPFYPALSYNPHRFILITLAPKYDLVMALKPSLSLKLGQQLRMTPQLQQAIKLLQLSTLDLQQEIQDALDSNLMLEEYDEQSESSPEDTPTDEGELPINRMNPISIARAKLKKARSLMTFSKVNHPLMTFPKQENKTLWI